MKHKYTLLNHNTITNVMGHDGKHSAKSQNQDSRTGQNTRTHFNQPQSCGPPRPYTPTSNTINAQTTSLVTMKTTPPTESLTQHHKQRGHVPNVPDAEIVNDWPFTGGSGVSVTCKLCKWSLCHIISHTREAASSKPMRETRARNAESFARHTTSGSDTRRARTPCPSTAHAKS